MEEKQLTKYKSEIQEIYLEPLRNNIAFKEYVHTEETRERVDGPFQRDYTRIIYSSSFRRLQGKMQLLGIRNDQYFRNRLTHSLEVAQIARSIAFSIGYDAKESYVVEAGALAHDIGNPPFGHAGERKLHELFKDVGGFEGNAQTLRVLTNIERKRPDYRGLNLTYRTLLSVVKYYRRYDGKAIEPQKFIYDDDYNLLDNHIRKNGLKLRTLDVQIVDIADEIAYAAHDLEDGLKVNAFTCDELLHEYGKEYGKNECFEKLNDIVENSKKKAGYLNKKIDSMQYSKQLRQELCSALIHCFMCDIGLVEVPEENKKKTCTKYEKELGFVQYEELVHGLKKIVFQCINHNDAVYHYEKIGEVILEKLSEFYKNDPMYLPPEYRASEVKRQYDDLKDLKNDALQERLTCDYLAGMMESYAIKQYEKYIGKKVII